MALKEDLVTEALVGLAAEEVVESDLVERGGRRVGREMTADPVDTTVRARNHDRGVPPHVVTKPRLQSLVTRERRLCFGRDRVDVVGDQW